MKKYKMHVDTSTTCFFCFKKLSKMEDNKIVNFGQIYSIQSVFSYLKIDLGKTATISGTLVPLLENTEVFVTLCAKCLEMTETFSELYKNVVDLQAKMNSSLESIQHQILESKRNPEAGREYQQVILNNPKATRHSRMVQKLRQELITKCDAKVQSIQPELKLVRINEHPGKQEPRSAKPQPPGGTRLSSISLTSGAPTTTTNRDSSPIIQQIIKTEMLESTPGEDDEEIDSFFDQIDLILQKSPQKKKDMSNGEATPALSAVPESNHHHQPNNHNNNHSPHRLFVGKHRHKYQCLLCQKSFTTSTELNQRRTRETLEHIGKPLKCKICFKKIANKYTLATHLKIHAGKKDYKCRFCEKAFTQKGNCEAHEKVKHWKELGLRRKKSAECDECGKRFYSKHQLKAHQAIHATIRTKFNCGCGKSFKRKETLEAHMESCDRMSDSD